MNEMRIGRSVNIQHRKKQPQVFKEQSRRNHDYWKGQRRRSQGAATGPTVSQWLGDHKAGIGSGSCFSYFHNCLSKPMKLDTRGKEHWVTSFTSWYIPTTCFPGETMSEGWPPPHQFLMSISNSRNSFMFRTLPARESGKWSFQLSRTCSTEKHIEGFRNKHHSNLTSVNGIRLRLPNVLISQQTWAAIPVPSVSSC